MATVTERILVSNFSPTDFKGSTTDDEAFVEFLFNIDRNFEIIAEVLDDIEARLIAAGI